MLVGFVSVVQDPIDRGKPIIKGVESPIPEALELPLVLHLKCLVPLLLEERFPAVVYDEAVMHRKDRVSWNEYVNASNNQREYLEEFNYNSKGAYSPDAACDTLRCRLSQLFLVRYGRHDLDIGAG